jgi:hypothetical protein
MKISFHPLTDQLVQWWVVRLFRRDPSLLDVPRNVVTAFACGVCHNAELLKLDGAEPAMANPLNYPSKELGAMGGAVVRRVVDISGAFKPEMEKVVDAMTHEMTNLAIEEMRKELNPTFQLLQQGIFRPIGWDRSGRMEWVVTEKGAKETDIEKGTIYTSVIGWNG